MNDSSHLQTMTPIMQPHRASAQKVLLVLHYVSFVLKKITFAAVCLETEKIKSVCVIEKDLLVTERE